MPDLTCPGCRRQLTVKPGFEGKTLQCPACQAEVTVPSQPSAAPRDFTRLPAASPGGGRKRSSVSASLVISILALAASGTALTLVILRPGMPGKGLGAYDFSTPQSAVKSGMLIRAHADVRAQTELQVAQAETMTDSRLKVVESLAFGETKEQDGKVCVMYKYTEHGRQQRGAAWMEKRKDGRYYPVMPPGLGLGGNQPGNADIAKRILEWMTKKRP